MKASMSFVFRKLPVLAAFLLVFSGTAASTALAESYSAAGMRLLKYEGSVEIEDASGQPRFVLENVRFDSGEALKTGKDSSASVGLDDDRIVTLDEESRVEFTLKDKHMEMLLTEGGLLLDVQDKLGDDETLDIKTSTIAVGIRGTIVYLREVEAKTDGFGFESVGLGAGQEAASGRTTVLGILEGTAELSYQDEQGTLHTLPVSAGQKATLKDSNTNAFADSQPAITELTQDDIRGFIEEQIQSNPVMEQRVEAADSIREAADYPAGGDWTWDGPVTLVAQSASKLYDGSPLTRPGDVLVYGLPEGFSIRVSAGGSQTDAGTGSNPVSDYVIFNAAGEEVTSHFSNIQTVSGALTVDPAPLTAWTASASKTYDGTPLTNKEAEIHFYPGHESGEAPWRNSSFVVRGGGTAVSGATGTSASGTTASGTAGGVAAGIAGGAVSGSAGGDAAGKSGTSTTPAPADAAAGIAPGTEKADTEVLYGICGTIWVHGTNPITEETREIQLSAGEKMTVYLSSGGADGQTLEFKVDKISENELPEEILRLYADNPELMKQACADTGWNEQLLEQLIAELPAASESNAAVVEQNGLQVDESAAEALMRDCTNVRITIDTQITDYNGRALGNEEAHYTGVNVDDTIKITATGSQTDVGESANTYEIDWGQANPGNYIFNEDPGTLTVTAAPATVTTGSASKACDGTPLTNEEASITGLVNGETATVTATGSITEAGTAVNTYTIDWGSTNSANYALTEQLGMLTVTNDQTPKITLTAESASKTYDGTPLTGDSVTAEGLPEGFTYTAKTQGSQTDAGTSPITVSSYTILDQDGKDVTKTFSDIKTVGGTLTVEPAEASVETGSAQKAYDGKALQNAEASITGLVETDEDAVTVNATGSITKVGTTDNTYTIDWGTANSANYSLAESLGTLEVTKNDTEITFTAASNAKTYDGTPLSAGGVTVTGLPEGFTYTAQTQGSQTNAGTSANTVASYAILNQDEEDVTGSFTGIKTADGTLKVNPADAAVKTGSAQKVYDGKALQSAEVSITGLTDADAGGVTVTATGSITKAGTTENTYTIDWGTANSANYSLAESLGTLEVTKNDTEITFTAASDTKTYDGTPLSAGGITVTGLPEGFTYTAKAQGSQTNVGTSANTVASYAILNQNEEDVTDSFTNIKTADGTLTVNPADLTIETGSAQKAYDGKALQNAEVSITGLAETDKDVTVTATGSITKVGTTENTCTIDWGTIDSANYNLTVTRGTLEVTKNNTAITLTSASASKVYDGTPISATGVTVEGLPDGFTCQASAGGAFSTPPDVGEYKNAFDDMSYTFENEDGEMMAGWRYYVIRNADGEDVTDHFTNVTLVEGTLAITPLKITFDLNCYEAVFSGYQWVPDGINGTYENGSEAGSEVEQESETMETDAFELPVHLTSIFNLTGGGQLRLDCDGYKDAGSYDITPTETFLSGSAGNYEITYTNNTMVISPMPVTLTLGPESVVYDGNAHSRSLVSASCDEIDASIRTLSDTEWEVYGYTVMINEAFNVKIEGGGTDPGTYTLNMSFTFANNDPGNYVIEPASASLTIEPLELIIDLGNPEAAYDSNSHGGTISVTYGNGSSAGSSPEAISAKSNIGGSASTEYMLTTGDTFIVSIAGAGPDPGEYTLPCSYTFTPDRSSCYDVQVTGDTLTITDVSAEGWTPGGAAAPDEKNPAGQNASDAAGEQKTLVSAAPGETDPNGQNASGTTGEAGPDGQSAQAMPRETDPDGQSTSDTAGNTDPAGQNTSDAGTSGETGPDGQNASGTTGETDPDGQNASGSDTPGETGPDGQDSSDSASAGPNEQIPAAETEKKETQAETQAPAAQPEKKEAPAETQAPASEAEKKEAPAETQAPASETEKKEALAETQAPASETEKKEAPAETLASAAQAPAAETGKKETQAEKESETEQA